MLLRDHNGIPLHGLTGLSVADGKLNDYSAFYSSGLLPDLDIATAPADIWTQGGVYVFSSSAVTYYLSSTEVADDQLIRIDGLDEDWLPQSKTATLSGQTKIAIPGTWRRINFAENIDSTPVTGNIYFYEDDTTTDGVPDTASKVRAIGTYEFQYYGNAIYTVPAGKTAFIISCFSNIGPKKSTPSEDKSAILNFLIRKHGKTFRMVAMRVANKYESTVFHTFDPPCRVPEKSDIKVNCSECYVNDTKIYAGFNLVLKNN